MAWYDGTYACGHEGRVDVIGPSKSRQWKIDRHFSGLCPDCWEKERQEQIAKENAEARERSAEMELPELTGTEKQVAWANTLRLKVVDAYEAELEERREKEDLILSFDHAIRTKTEARFWIDARNDEHILKSFCEEYRKYLADLKIPQDIREELQEEKDRLTVIPECRERESGVVDIVYNAIHTEVSISSKRSDKIIKIARRLGYSWAGMWNKEITEYTGDIDERAAELGNELLNAGFAVSFPNEKTKERAISGDFEPECHRWIKYSKKEIVVEWKPENDALRKAAKNLPGAAYYGGNVKVSAEFYREILDFAETMGFKISKEAQEAIEAYKEKEKRFEIVNVTTMNKESTNDSERIKKILKSDEAILEDLIDEA